MAVTLAQIKVGLTDALSMQVIDEFRKSSYVLDSIPFDPVVNPATGGATWTYGYTRVTTLPTAGTRAINSEFTPQHAVRTPYTTDLAIFGGAFEIDRAIAKTRGVVDEVTFQIGGKVTATRAEFHNLFINGDTGSDANAFDGLDKAVTGSSTEFLPLANGVTAGYVDLSDSTAMDAGYKAFLDLMDLFLASLDGKPNALLMGSKLKAKIKSIARRAGYYSQSEDAFGRTVDEYDGIALVDMGDKPGTATPICATVGRDADGAGSGGTIAGLADLYAVRFGLDGCHAVSLAGVSPISQYLPDMTQPGAVKLGEVEMIASVALKATRAAGVFRNIKVAATSEVAS